MNAKQIQAEAVSLSSLMLDRLGVIRQAILSTEKNGGEAWECGAYRGGTALWMKSVLMETDSNRIIRVFDTFEGLPYSGEFDRHLAGKMKADYEEVRRRFEGLSNCFIYKGIMPSSFAGLEDRMISVAHIDVDQYQSVKECLEWVYPRVHQEGWIILDDYNCSDCPGARKATDEFLLQTGEVLNEATSSANPQRYFIKRRG